MTRTLHLRAQWLLRSPFLWGPGPHPEDKRPTPAPIHTLPEADGAVSSRMSSLLGEERPGAVGTLAWDLGVPLPSLPTPCLPPRAACSPTGSRVGHICTKGPTSAC